MHPIAQHPTPESCFIKHNNNSSFTNLKYSLLPLPGESKMISSSKLIKHARKWQKLASLRRKRISWLETLSADSCSTSSTADKGHFVVYSIDGRRFEIQLAYLRNQIIAELLQAAEEEFGLPKNGPITLPCDGVSMDYALSLIQRCSMDEDLQRALAMSIATSCSLTYSKLVPEQRSQHCDPSICSF
ncbi:hypothetical protein Dimus_002766 [Dionaea muscipula]